MLKTELIRPLPELLARHAKERGADPAFSDERRSVTWAELDNRTARLAAHLGTRLAHGSAVAISMANRVEAIESYLGVARAGSVGAFLNPAASGPELSYMPEDSGAEVLIVDAEHREGASRAIAHAAGLGQVIVVDGSGGHEHDISYEALVDADAGAEPPDDLELDEPAWMLYTSGTTGRPKGVLLTQRSCLWAVAACWAPIVGLSAEDEVGAAAVSLLRARSRRGCRGRHRRPRAAAPAFLERPRDRAPSLRAAHLPPGCADAVPLPARAARRPGPERARAAPVLSAGAIMPGALGEAFERAAGVPLLDGYGITETSTMVTMSWPTGARPRGSCGLPLPGCAVRLVDPVSGADVQPGEDGELLVRGPQVMLGYHNRSKETAEVLRDGWYHTGDLARADPDGFLTITGRIKELIIRGGENIYPAEVEHAAAEHLEVVDAAVIGKPDQALGEIVVAFVVPRGDALELGDLRSFMGERLAAFKLPSELHLIEQIPRTGSGKIKRHQLRDLLDAPRESGVSA